MKEDCPNYSQCVNLGAHGWLSLHFCQCDIKAAFPTYKAPTESNEKLSYLGMQPMGRMLNNPDLPKELPSIARRVRKLRQATVLKWTEVVFGKMFTVDLKERLCRLLEETLELCQAEGMSIDQAHKLVSYVYGRPAGDPEQELGGIGVCLLAYAEAKGLSADDEEVKEINRCLKIENFPKIREKQNKKAEQGVGRAADPGM